jgi:AraC-like DNA-binding protein
MTVDALQPRGRSERGHPVRGLVPEQAAATAYRPVSALLGGADVSFRPPDPRLISHLSCFYAFPVTRLTRLRALPDGCTYLTAELRDGQRPKTMFTGPRRASAVVTHRPPKLLLGVRLAPASAFLLLEGPVHAVAGRRLPLARIVPLLARELEDRLGTAELPDDHLAILEAFLLERLTRLPVDGRVRRAMDLIHISGGAATVAQVASRAGVSPRTLRRLLLEWIGLSPKRLCRIARFQKLLDGLGRGATRGWADAAAEAGYADQPHLIRDVSELASDTPRRLARGGLADSFNLRCDEPRILPSWHEASPTAGTA